MSRIYDYKSIALPLSYIDDTIGKYIRIDDLLSQNLLDRT
jgi:hypothetical protein